MVIVPIVVGDTTIEPLRLISLLRHIEHVVFVAVFLFQERFDLYLK